MHDNTPPAAVDPARFERDFAREFRPLSNSEQERAEHQRYVRDHSDDPLRRGQPAPSFEEWRRQRAARGNREGFNHD